VVACQPIPRGHLRTEPSTTALASSEVHFVVRVNADALALAEWVSVTVSVPAEGVDAVALLPDDPELTGVSVGSGALFVNLSASLGLAEMLRERCDADGICEVGITAIVTPSTDVDGIAASEVSLTASASTEPEGRFPETALLELEIDGEAPIAGARFDR
jgi:hypothetical protein